MTGRLRAPIAICLAVWWWLITYGTGNPFWQERLSSSYDSLARNLSKGSAEVAESEIGWEGFEIGSKRYMYFGPLPALLRILPLELFPSRFGQWGRLSCCLAGLVALGAFAAALRRAMRLNPAAPARLRGALAWIAILGLGLSSPLLYLMSSGRLYHEAILWGLAFSLSFLTAALPAIDGEPVSPRRLAALSGLAGCALLSRITFALPLYLLLTPLAWQSWRKGAARAPRIAAALAPALAAGILQLWYNHARFGSIFVTADYRHHYFKVHDFGGVFNLARLPDTLRLYLAPLPETFLSAAPWARMPTVSYAAPKLFFEWREEILPVTISPLWLLFLALLGAAKLSASRPIGLLTAAAFALQTLLILSYGFVSERFVAEFLPLMALLAYHFARYSELRPWHALSAAPLAAFSCAVSFLGILHWQIYHYDQGEVRWRQKLMSWIVPEPRLPRSRAELVYLGDLQPISVDLSRSFPELRAKLASHTDDFRGRSYDKLVYTHAPASFSYEVPEGARSFQAVIASPNHILSCPVISVRLELKDQSGNLLYRSEIVRGESHASGLPLIVNLQGANELHFNVDPTPDGRDCDHLQILEAGFLIPRR